MFFSICPIKSFFSSPKIIFSINICKLKIQSITKILFTKNIFLFVQLHNLKFILSLQKILSFHDILQNEKQTISPKIDDASLHLQIMKITQILIVSTLTKTICCIYKHKIKSILVMSLCLVLPLIHVDQRS